MVKATIMSLVREYDRAFGRLAACCTAMGARFRGDIDQNGNQILIVRHRGGVFTIQAGATGSYFTAFNERRLTYIPDFPLSESIPIVDLENDDIKDIIDDIGATNIQLDPLSSTQDGDAIEYFDGFRAAKPLFLHGREMTVKEFDEELSELDHANRVAFRQAKDQLGIDIDLEEAAGSDEGHHDSGPAFQ